jgi:hypothetical protein
VAKSRSLRSQEGIDNTRQMVSGATGFSAKVPGKSISKNERWVLQMLATKFHTEPETETESGVKLNPVMRYIFINEHADNTCHPTAKKKRSKRRKSEAKTEMIESIGETFDWWSTLEEEIAKLR